MTLMTTDNHGTPNNGGGEENPLTPSGDGGKDLEWLCSI